MSAEEEEKKLRVGFVGCGNHARTAVYPCLRTAPIDLCAVSDLIPEKAREVAGWFGAVGLVDFRLEEHAGLASSRDLPATFIASARRPS